MRSKNGLSRDTGNYGHNIQTKQANKTCHKTQKTKQMLIVVYFCASCVCHCL